MAENSNSEWRDTEEELNFDHAGGAWDGDDGFQEAEEITKGAGSHNQYTAKIKKPISTPYQYTVDNSSPIIQQVNMFGAESSLNFLNALNPLYITFNYSFNGYWGNGTPNNTQGYFAFLQRTIAQSFSFGRIRMESNLPLQLSQPIAITDQDPTGRQLAYPDVQYVNLNQFFAGAVETQCDITVYGGTQLAYNHLPNPLASSLWKGGSFSDQIVTWYFWAAEVASLTRHLEGKPLIKQTVRPDTLLTQTARFERKKKAAANAPKKFYLPEVKKFQKTLNKTIGKQ